LDPPFGSALVLMTNLRNTRSTRGDQTKLDDEEIGVLVLEYRSSRADHGARVDELLIELVEKLVALGGQLDQPLLRTVSLCARRSDLPVHLCAGRDRYSDPRNGGSENRHENPTRCCRRRGPFRGCPRAMRPIQEEDNAYALKEGGTTWTHGKSRIGCRHSLAETDEAIRRGRTGCQVNSPQRPDDDTASFVIEWERRRFVVTVEDES
jgi:hypothetical protein